jgi:hypothetical protein
MDPLVIQALLGGLLGTGGLAGLLTVIKTIRTRRDSPVPSDETEARRTADWGALNTYFQGELKTVREDKKRELGELKKEMEKLRRNQELLRDHFQAQADADAEHIDILEEHIWRQLPPPPPPRRRPSAPPPILGT